MKVRWWSVLGLILLAQGCWHAQDNEGRATVLGPEMVPIAVGAALYNEVQDIDLNLEFIVSSRCVRMTPLDTFRFTLTRLGASQNEVLLDQFVAKRSQQVQHPKLVKGRYEIQVIHQDRPQARVKKIFTIQEKSPLVLVDVPCLD